MAKVTLASDWLAGCSGCHMSLLDTDEQLIALLEHIELSATPITDLKQPPASGVTVGVLEGAVANSATEEVARRMRGRCKILIALGDCAVFGGVPTMRNRVCVKAALQRAYIESESTVDGRIPDDPELATATSVRPLGDVVTVDVNIPGCPPSPESILFAVRELLAGRTPVLTGKTLDWH